MNTIRELNWPLIIVLGLAGLARPITRMIFDGQGVTSAVLALGMTAVVTIAWALALGLSRSPQPVLGGVATGLIYALGAIILSAVLSPILLGRLDGTLANPIAIVPMLLTNAVWGAAAGAIALVVRRVRWGTWNQAAITR